MDPNNNLMPGDNDIPLIPTPPASTPPAVEPPQPMETPQMPEIPQIPEAPQIPETPQPESTPVEPPIIDTAALEAAMADVNPTADVVGIDVNPNLTPQNSIAPNPVLDAPIVDFQDGTTVNTSELQNDNQPTAQEQDKEKSEEKAGFIKKDDEEEPIVAAEPVPGSIGSAKSYVDVKRAEAEQAEKMAIRQNGKIKFDRKNIIILIFTIVLLIAIGVMAMVILSGNNQPAQPQESSNDTVEEEHTFSTLSCKRNLTPEESFYKSKSGTQENIFYFKDDELDGLVTNFTYTFDSKQNAETARDNLKRNYKVTELEDEDSASESVDVKTDSTTKKTVEEMLYHYVKMDGLVVTHGMEVKSEDIKAWLESDAYSDETYGATKSSTTEDTEETEEIVRNLKYYNRLQNGADYTCSISRGY